jgi:hypothetical protein
MEQNRKGRDNRQKEVPAFCGVCEKSYPRSRPQNEALDTFAENQSPAGPNPLAIKTLLSRRVCILFAPRLCARGVYSSALALKRIM